MSRINNPKEYFKHITRLLNKGVIELPKNIKELVTIRNEGNRIVGWEIDGKEIYFHNTSYLDVDELGIVDKSTDAYELMSFSYHFEPNNQEKLLSYRIDYKNGDLHANDNVPGGAHFSLGQIDIRFDDFNLCVAITLALLYINNGTYPLQDGNYYNSKLRKIKEAFL